MVYLLKKLFFCNIGNPQQLKQKPITFNRNVMSLVNSPHLLSDPNISKLFPEDSIKRANFYL